MVIQAPESRPRCYTYIKYLDSVDLRELLNVLV
jgi:hypothetical protein